MPYATQEMLDQIDAATAHLYPDGRKTRKIHYTLGAEFDEYFHPKYLFEPMPPGMVERFERLHEEMKPKIVEELIAVQLEIAERRASGELVDEPPLSGRPSVNLRDLVSGTE